MIVDTRHWYLSESTGPTLMQLFITSIGVIVGLFSVLAMAALAATALRRTIIGRVVVWLWARLVSTPVTNWLDRVVSDRIEVLVKRPNGGSSLHDLSTSLADLKEQFAHFATTSSSDRADLHRQLEQLLDHDAERDVAGKRYGA